MNSSEKITGRIIAVAQSEADEILLAARNEADAITEEYKKNAAEIAANEESEATLDAESIRSRTVASAQKIKRNLLLEAKNAKIDEAFEKARLKLLGLGEAESGDSATGEFNVKSHVVPKYFSVEVTPAHDGAKGIRAPKCSVSFQFGYSTQEGNYADLTFGILDGAAGYWYKRFTVKKS